MRKHIVRSLFLFMLAAGLPVAAVAQSDGIIQGRVTDANTGEPLAGAHVSVDRAARGVLSREDGRYMLLVPGGEHTLEVAYMGYAHDTVAVDLAAGQVLPIDLPMSPSYLRLGGVVVTAGFEGRARSLNEMKTTISMKNVVFEEQFQRMPDETVADAVSRVPGMASTFDSNTGYLGYEGDVPETSDISLRGLAPGMLAVNIDGQRVPSTSAGGRSVELAGLSLQSIQSLEVVKAVTPDMDADAAAGAINLRTQTPREFHGSASLMGGRNDLVGTTDYRASADVGDRIGSLSYMLTGAFSRLRPGTDIVSNSWADREFDTGPEMVIRRFTMTNSQADRRRTTLNSNLTWEFTPRSHLRFRGTFSDYRNDVATNFLQLRPGTFNTPLETTGGQVRRRGLFTDTHTTTLSGMLGGEHPIGGATLNYGVGLARSELSRPEYLLVENRMNDVDVVYDRSDPVFTEYDITSGQDLFDPSEFFITTTQRRDDFTYDEDRSAFIDLTLPPALLGTTAVTLKTGAKYTDRSRDRDYLRYFPSPADETLWMTDIATSEEFRTVSPRGYRLGYVVDRARAHNFVDANQDLFGTTIDISRSDAGEHEALERIFAGYAMATVEVGPLTLTGGGRVESAQNEYVGVETVLGPDGEHIGSRPLASDSDNFGFFPGVHVHYEASPQNVLRFAWTNTIARPAFDELAPTENVDYESNRISRGNPDLLPTESMNVDAQYDWYGPLGDHVSLGVFFKELTNFTGRESSVIEGGTYDGFDLTQWDNFGDATTYGVETAVYKRLGFFPGPLRSLGLNANYTWAGSSTDFTQGRDLPLPNQSPHTVNVGLDFDHGPFRSSVAAQYQSDRLRHIGQDERYDMYLSRGVTVDLSAAMDVRSGLEIYTQISNVTGTPTYLYAGNDRLYPQRASFSEAIWMIGSRYAF